jgi:hypothetical protein
MNIAARCGGFLLGLGLLPLSSRADECTLVLAQSEPVMPPFVISNGCLLQAVTATNAESGRAVYHFTITNSGSYVLQALVDAPQGQTNSLLLNIDAEPQRPAMLWEMPPTVGFTNQLVFWRGEPDASLSYLRRKVFNLPQGQHQLIIRGGSGKVQVARIAVLSLPPPPTGLRVITGPDP